jgi:PIN domain nuclease of toxin-antitoxin system
LSLWAPGALLDTHALYWLVSGTDDLTNEALVAIGENQAAGTLFASPMTAWELAVAAQKRPGPGRPDLGG